MFRRAVTLSRSEGSLSTSKEALRCFASLSMTMLFLAAATSRTFSHVITLSPYVIYAVQQHRCMNTPFGLSEMKREHSECSLYRSNMIECATNSTPFHSDNRGVLSNSIGASRDDGRSAPWTSGLMTLYWANCHRTRLL